MGCNSSIVKEEKRIMDHFLLLVKIDERSFTISNYEENYNKILKKSQNDFKKLEKKQKVRLNFVADVNKTIFCKEEHIQAEFKTKRILFFIIVLTITTKKYIEENILSNVNEITKMSNESNLWIDIEQVLFNIVNKLISKNYNNPLTFVNVFYYSSMLLQEITSHTNNFDNFINLEKFINKMKTFLDLVERPEELAISRNTMINILGLAFEKTGNISLSVEAHKFIIALIFSTIASKADYVMKNEQVKNVFKEDRFYKIKDNKSEYSMSENNSISGLFSDRTFLNLRDNIDSFYRYIERYTTDVSAGKKIWKQVETFLDNKTNDTYITSVLLEISILYIFNRTRIRSMNTVNNSFTYFPQKGKILLSSIFEYLCDKLSSGTLEQQLIPSQDSINATIDNKLGVVSADKIQSAVVEKNLNLFYEIIYNHYDGILIDHILSERYMQYFAKIFMEDVLNDTLNTKNYNIEVQEEKLIDRLCEILSQNNEPARLFISLLSNISKLFNNQAKINYDHQNEKINEEYLNRVLKKLILFVHKFYSLGNKIKSSLDRDELFHMIQNFSVDNDELRLNCIIFFINFFIFIEYNCTTELEYIHRKKIYLIIFEMFYELISNFTSYNNPNLTIQEFMKLIEVLIIMMKNYSQTHFEDAYLIYKLNGMIFKKIGGSNKLYTNFSMMKSFESQPGLNKRILNNIQLGLSYLLINFNMYLISGFYQLSNANPSFVALNFDLTANLKREDFLRELLDTLFKSIDLTNLPDTLSFIKKKFLSILDDNQVIPEETLKIVIDTVNFKYFSKTSVINVVLEHEMQNRNMQIYMRELGNNEMTFRDFSINKIKESEIFSEHNFSMFSNRDIDGIDDMSIVLTEDKRNENIRDSSYGFFNARSSNAFGQEDSFRINRKDSVRKVSGLENNLPSENVQIFSPMKKPNIVSEMDNYLLRNNQVNNIKI